MELWQLRYFVRVAETRSIAQASAYLRVAAPAISRSIKSLEEGLKVRLFERDGRGMHLTTAGELLMQRATSLLRDAELARQAVTATNAHLEGQVTIGATPSFIAMTGHAFMRRCTELYPLVRPKILEGYSIYLEDWVRTGAVDIAVVNGLLPGERRISATLLGAERLFAIGRPGRFGPSREGVPLRAVLAEALLLPSGRNRIRGLLDKAAQEQGLQVLVRHEVDSVGLLRDLVMDGMAQAVLPYGAVMREVEAGLLEAACIIEPEIHSDIHLIHAAELPPGPVASAAVELIRGALGEFQARAPIPVLVDGGRPPKAELRDR